MKVKLPTVNDSVRRSSMDAPGDIKPYIFNTLQALRHVLPPLHEKAMARASTALFTFRYMTVPAS